MESVASKDVLLHQRNLEEGQDDQPDLSVSQAAEAEQLLDMEDEVVAPPVTKPAATLDQGQQESISVSKATQSMRPPSAPERDCTYIAINKYRMSDLVAPNLMGGDLLSVGECGSLYGYHDNRQILCFTKLDFGRKQNIMFSFNPGSMTCRCCDHKVFYKRNQGGHSEPRTVILSDQHFPACLPATSGEGMQCLKIIRIEFGSLWELTNTFIKLVRSKDLIVPTGSTILIGSASHLSNIVISAYAEELAAVCKRLCHFFNKER